MSTYTIGDIHGGYKALVQCLERSGFDKQKDRLITLGDIVDSWSQTPECVDELLTIEDRIDIRGNHDVWCWNWFEYGATPKLWLEQGGQATVDAYVRTGKLTDEDHKQFFNRQVNYYIDDDNRLFVHAGYVESVEASKHRATSIMRACELHWDRSLWENLAMAAHNSWKKGGNSMPKVLKQYKEIFIGHTATTTWNTTEPMNRCNVWNLDTGGGWHGKLTIMDVDTKQYWQSDEVQELYPEEARVNQQLYELKKKKARRGW